MSDATTIRVGGPAPYDVVVGHAVTRELPALLGSGVAQVAVIAPVSLHDFGTSVGKTLGEAGFPVRLIEVPDGEDAKTATVAAACWQALGDANFTRSDAIVGVGGGATTDLAGFVAATWLRGVKVVHVPTTLLAMVDAAVGGKTGINTAAGKNLVGSFHTPAGVLCSLTALETLPGPEWVSGMAEVVKAGFIADPVILDLVESDSASAAVATGPHTLQLITRAIQVKADVVAVDLKETGAVGSIGREMLNYGHTLGHAIEKVEDYRWRHGEAIAVGMVFVAELAALQGRIPHELVRRHRKVLSDIGLPVSYRGDRWEELHAAMRVDKKSRADRLRFVVLDGLGTPVIAESPAPEDLVEAYKRVSERSE
ncbi:3-dehydroquinate synthase [Sporichthya sp.]|uniref:3-dehydroquinate synthase n=1 Tax=Sporichthya sp. TaxID=65475 RepID=UPI00182F24EA|nr:3-dehydroquinate synthase [Sporichthya sp.]MBA3742536.1 3-dehydroquinate synthase [Sporichthya sp.]